MDLRTLLRYNRFMRMKSRTHPQQPDPGLAKIETTNRRMVAISQRSADAADRMADAMDELRYLAKKASNQP